MEIALRMQTNHYKIANAPKAHVYTNAPNTLRSLFRQRLRWTYGFLQNSKDYRFLFFNKNYGTLGMFILPMAIVSFLPALFFSALLVKGGISIILTQIERINAIGLFSLPQQSFDIFFMSTNSMLFLVYIIALMTLALIIIGKKFSTDKIMGFDIPLYLLLYGFLAPWWLARGVIDSSRSKKQSWTQEINARPRT